MKLILIFLITITVVANRSDGQCQSGYKYYVEGYGWLKMHKKPQLYHDAETICREEGAELTFINVTWVRDALSKMLAQENVDKVLVDSFHNADDKGNANLWNINTGMEEDYNNKYPFVCYGYKLDLHGCNASTANVIKVPIGYNNSDRFFYFPGDGDGLLHLVDSKEPVDEALVANYTRNSNNNAYWLFTRANPITAQVLVFGDADSVKNSSFNFDKDVVVLAHGWKGHGANEMNIELKQAFLQNNDVNVIVLDWNRLANSNYVTAKYGVPAVGRGLGQFLIWLVNIGTSHERIHLVGFSLGGHLVGNAGRETSSNVKRITALEPAGPLWSNDDEGRVVPTDGQYVEVIHTNTVAFGYSDLCGVADFYPNGGSFMPGCWLFSCSHTRAWMYMAASVEYNHLLSNECDSLYQAQQSECSGTLNPMGNSDFLKSSPGIFRRNTKSQYPF